MSIRKSGLYSSLWDSCDELRGGMDASFADTIALKSKSDIGDRINTQIIQHEAVSYR